MLLVNYIFRVLFILVGAFNISNVIRFYHEGSYFACGLQFMLAIYMAIYLFKLSMVT